MAIAGTQIWEVEFGGSDTLNGGGFDPGTGTRDAVLTSTASTANTSTPEVSSANYTFVSGDVNTWLFIKSGTNWIPGWYQITSVTAGKATINAAIGSAYLYINGNPSSLNTTVGCATVGTPTAGTWSIDYSIQASVAFSLTTLTTAAANAIILTASATKAMVGNSIQITGGTNFTTGIYTITAISAGVSITVDRNCTTAAGAAGTAGVGGAFASIGKAASVAVSLNYTFQKYSTSIYLITSASTNIAGGCFAPTGSHRLIGYNTIRIIANTDLLMPTNRASGISTATILTGTTINFRNIIVDGNSLTAIKGATVGTYYHCAFLNCTNGAIATATIAIMCLAQNCITTSPFSSVSCYNCAVITATGLTGFTASAGIAYNNCIAVACSIGFALSSTTQVDCCVAYNNSTDGFKLGSAGNTLNSISYSNISKGYNANATTFETIANCAAGNNGTDFDSAIEIVVGKIQLTANPFVNPGATINTIEDVFAAFALNTTAGGGASCRSAGIVPYQDIGAIQHKDPVSAPDPMSTYPMVI